MMSVLLIISIMNDVALFPLGLLFMLGGVGSIIDAIEGYFQADHKKACLIDIGLAVLWFVLAIQFLFL